MEEQKLRKNNRFCTNILPQRVKAKTICPHDAKRFWSKKLFVGLFWSATAQIFKDFAVLLQYQQSTKDNEMKTQINW